MRTSTYVCSIFAVAAIFATCLLFSGGCIISSTGAGWERVEWGTTGFVGVGRSNDGDKNDARSSVALDVDPLVDNIIDLKGEPSDPGDLDPNGTPE